MNKISILIEFDLKTGMVDVQGDLSNKNAALGIILAGAAMVNQMKEAPKILEVAH